MKSQLTFTPEVMTCCTRYNHCDYYYLILLVIYERLNILVTYCYNLHPAQPEEDWLRTGSSLDFFLGSYLSSEFFRDTGLLHLHYLLFGVLGWVSVQHFVTLADVKRTL
jgi:hypothetical protein